jgi:hypothetical protein
MSTAVNNEMHRQKDTNREVFTARYRALLAHYGIAGQRTQVSSPNENGDVEQRHHRFKRALDQQLMLRGSRDFSSVDHYRAFLRELFDQLNAGRRDALAEERAALGPLPAQRIDSCRLPIEVKVSRFSTIRVLGNVYSVHSRLRDEHVRVKIFVDTIEVWYAQKCIHTMERLRGKQKYHIDYRDIIDWLVRKPGAFARYRYRDDLFPTHRFRVAYDLLRTSRPLHAERDYLAILYLAARENESAVDEALRFLVDQEQDITPQKVAELVASSTKLPSPLEVAVSSVDLSAYDCLLGDGAPPAQDIAHTLHVNHA